MAKDQLAVNKKQEGHRERSLRTENRGVELTETWSKEKIANWDNEDTKGCASEE